MILDSTLSELFNMTGFWTGVCAFAIVWLVKIITAKDAISLDINTLLISWPLMCRAFRRTFELLLSSFHKHVAQKLD